MNTVSIYRAGVLLEEIHPDVNSAQVKQVMGENTITLNFTLNHAAGFQYGDYCTVYDELYKINTVPQEKKLGENLFQYNLKMEAEYFDLTKVQFLFLGDDNTLKETDFSLMRRASGFIDMLIQNANRVSPGWKKGDVISTIYKNLSFSKENCLTVGQRLAEEFETEFWVEGKTIHLSRRRNITDYVFHHGRNKGLYNITRQPLQGTKIVTRLYAFGSTRNLTNDYRNYTNRLKMTGGVDYIEQNTSQGIIEDVAVFEDIYPHRTGKVTALGGDIYTFYDNTLNFDIRQYLLPGVEPKLTFNTGQLAGYEFKLNRNFNPATGEIKILPNTEEKAVNVPSDLLSVQVGDQYVLHDISMPQSYIVAAEKELTKAANKLLSKISSPQYSYQIDVDTTYMKRRSRVIGIGMEVTIEDEDLNISEQLGIVSCTRNLQNEYKFSVEVSDQKAKGTWAQIQSSLTSNSRDISNIKNTYNTIQDNKVVGDLNISKGSINFDSLPVVQGALTEYASLYIHRTTGKIYREA